MTSKKSTLSSNLIMTKGQAKPSAIETPRGQATGGDSQVLNFRVTPEFRREFRLEAADQDIKLIDLLYASFEAYKRGK